MVRLLGQHRHFLPRDDHRESLKNLTAAAGESWREIKQSADAILSDARSAAASVIERFRGALGA